MNARKKLMVFGACATAPFILAVAIWFIMLMVKAYGAVKFMSDFQQINEKKSPLTMAQVEQLMGQPLRIDHSESTGITGDIYHYATYPPGGDFQVVFVNGVVLHTALPIYTIKS